MHRSTRWILVLCILAVAAAPLAAGKIDTGKLKAMAPRSIGPAAMSGRVTAITVDPTNRNTIYTGTASGGLWKSTDGGVAWTSIWDDQPVASIGSVAVDPRNPDVIWVGTGEGNPRNSQNVGQGIFKSIDGGRSWTRLGLEKTEHIHRVLINPTNGDIVYAAALGQTWGENEERGVYKTSDGGATWKRVLYVNQKTGAAEMVMDPTNPEKLIAAMWEHRRWPWGFKSGGEGSGLYVTHDGGSNWVRKTDKDGLPAGELGRIGLAFARSRPNIVYALVEAKKSGLYRSEDGGFSWHLVNDSNNVSNRPFYYHEIYVDPSNENRLYSLHSSVTFSEDGGKTFETLNRGIHPDNHAFYIDPNDPDFIMDGNDGGMAISHDRGHTWRFVENLPVGQFYHVRVDMQRPYNVYGGLQDNGSWRGPSQVWENGAILSAHWQMVSFGDGFDVVPDPTDPQSGYTMSQGGNLSRFNLGTGVSKSIRPPAPDGEQLRFNWNTGIGMDPFDPKTIYYGSQFVHRSKDRGETWEIVSPDLTTNDPEKQKQLDSGGLTYDVTAAENHTTIIAIAPSPVERGVLWVGTDDGNLQVTRDDGKSWKNVVGNVPGVPANTWVPRITPSNFKKGEAFVVFDDHRRSNWTPYAFKTSDYGATWTSLVTDDIRGYVYVLEQDTQQEDLLFLGTEFNLYVSVDGGQSWTRWDQGYPTVPTRDLAIHPRDGDLVIATFGRSFWIMDDIEPLRALAREGTDLLEADLHLFRIGDAIQANTISSPGVLFPGAETFEGKNREIGALISYILNKPAKAVQEDMEAAEAGSDGASLQDRPGPRGGPRAGRNRDTVKIEILDGDKVMRTVEGPAENGLNRFVWRLDRKGARLPGRFGGGRRGGGGNRGEPGGVPILPGTYTVRISYGEWTQEQPVHVLADPRIQASRQDMEAKSALIDDYLELVERLSEGSDRLDKAKAAMDRVNGLLAERGRDKAAATLRRSGRDVAKKLSALQEQISPAPVQGIRRDPTIVSSRVRSASPNYTWDAPNATEREDLRQAGKVLDGWLADIDSFFKGDWKKYEEAVKSARISLLPDFSPIKMR